MTYNVSSGTLSLYTTTTTTGSPHRITSLYVQLLLLVTPWLTHRQTDSFEWLYYKLSLLSLKLNKCDK